jgi:spermidine synthase
MKPGELWYTQYQTADVKFTFRVKDVIHTETSDYQSIEVLDTYQFGRMLILDQCIMFTEKDEHIYHEILVHPAMVCHPNPKKILVIGGGDGGALREIIKYEVESAKLVEIDARVIEVSKKFFPALGNSFLDNRVTTITDDGATYVKKAKESFDIIFVDSPDPVGHAEVLVKGNFIYSCAKLLKNNGIFVAQTQALFYESDFISQYLKSVKKNFPIVKPYFASIPTYAEGPWSFTFASFGVDPLNIKRKAKGPLRYYNEEMHKASFVLPEDVKKILL